MPTSPTPTAVRLLKAASASADGVLPVTASPKVLRALLADGYMYQRDSDGYRLSVEDALTARTGTLVITLEGRRAILSTPQLYALSRHVEPSGRLAPNVTWQTAKSLAALGLVEYRDANGATRTNDGDTGVSGAVHYPFRTDLGGQVAELAAVGPAPTGARPLIAAVPGTSADAPERRNA
ncbi:hypothetical protein MHW47_06055 [Streptomyces sp. OfavH-34-F]|uniref:hypothetical protein n=1 Tax=Streptomyces sp. OfavH-34-F TaxID=2917760 RepID=UPI001EF204E8|nr:hypothetical protein [Streptomyces sp. OfavH-34-F]MCG7524005.1 hypothetical protein [Streptomyces sp. OfavH-34-F]